MSDVSTKSLTSVSGDGGERDAAQCSSAGGGGIAAETTVQELVDGSAEAVPASTFCSTLTVFVRREGRAVGFFLAAGAFEDLRGFFRRDS